MMIADCPIGFDPEEVPETKDRGDNWWRVLEGASSHIILTGTVVGIEGLEGPAPYAVVDWQGISVRIPGEKLFLGDWDPDRPMPALYQHRMGRMLGATVDFVPIKVCRRDNLVLGDRSAVLGQKQRDYWDSGLVHPGTRAQARVIGVTRDRVTIELFGVETDIPKEGLSWAWFADARDRYQAGDTLLVRVTLTAKKEGCWSALVTCKGETAQPDRERLLRLVPGSTYLGTVTDVSEWDVQVRLAVGVNASADPLPEEPLPQPGDQAAVLITRISQEDQIAYGALTAVWGENSEEGSAYEMCV